MTIAISRVISRVISRRGAALGIGASMLPAIAAANIASLAAAAREEGELTWYVAQMDTETAERFGRVFSETYPGIRVAVTRVTGQVALQRLMLDIKNQTPHCDVFSTTDISHMPGLKARGELSHYQPLNFANMKPRFQALSDRGWYHATNAGRWILVSNTNKVKPEAAPKNWTDLTDPKWKGQLGLAHPGFSGGGGIWALAMKNLYGWRFFEDLAKNNPRVSRSTIDTVTLIGGGECLIGPTFSLNAYRAIDNAHPIAIAVPSDGVVGMVFPSAIPAHAPHPNAARLFMEWSLSEAFSNMLAAGGGDPIHAAVTPRAGETGTEGQKVLAPTVEEIRAGVPEVIERWRDIFGG